MLELSVGLISCTSNLTTPLLIPKLHFWASNGGFSHW